MAQSQNSNSLLDTSGLGNLSDARITIIHTEWNDAIVAEQIAGAKRVFDTHGITNVDYFAVPGSVELTFACKQAGRFANAIIAFGAVIRGGTPHFDYVCKSVTEGLTQLNIIMDAPVIFGVLTLDNEEQAWERLGGIHGHKGEEAAIAALKMIQLKRTLDKTI